MEEEKKIHKILIVRIPMMKYKQNETELNINTFQINTYF